MASNDEARMRIACRMMNDLMQGMKITSRMSIRMSDRRMGMSDQRMRIVRWRKIE